jgi:hypothetical protein
VEEERATEGAEVEGGEVQVEMRAKVGDRKNRRKPLPEFVMQEDVDEAFGAFGGIGMGRLEELPVVEEEEEEEGGEYMVEEAQEEASSKGRRRSKSPEPRKEVEDSALADTAAQKARKGAAERSTVSAQGVDLEALDLGKQSVLPLQSAAVQQVATATEGEEQRGAAQGGAESSKGKRGRKESRTGEVSAGASGKEGIGNVDPKTAADNLKELEKAQREMIAERSQLRRRKKDT